MRSPSELSIRSYGKRRPYAAPSSENLHAFEGRYSLRLPLDYVQFLGTVNGGAPTLNLAGDLGVNDFFGLGPVEPLHVTSPEDGWEDGNLWAETRVFRHFFAELGIPTNRHVPIARDGGGGLWLIECTTPAGAVDFVTMESRRLRRCFESFANFLDAFQPRRRGRRR